MVDQAEYLQVFVSYVYQSIDVMCAGILHKGAVVSELDFLFCGCCEGQRVGLAL
jgi:hypothetical protein